jgi:deoxyadenosine/deoxycytidine kinase
VIIWISGPTGSGKSTLAAHLVKVGYAIVQEALPAALFQEFRRSPAQYCAALQEAIMRGRRQGWSNVSGRGLVAFDRSVDEDLSVFCKLHLERGFINESAMDHLNLVGSALRAEMPEPDLIFYLRPSVTVLMERISQLEHPSFIRETLCRQVHLYDEWIETQRASMVRIDNGAASVASLTRLFEDS